MTPTTFVVNESLGFLQEYGSLINFIMLLAGLVGFGIHVGSFTSKFNETDDRVKKMLTSVERLNSCVDEIQVTLKAKIKGISFDRATIGLYGQSNSPIILKDEFRPLVERSGLEKQIQHRKSELVSWLKAKDPQTGLDAQDMIMDFVISDEVEKYLDTNEFKEYLYEQGMTLQDYYVILAIYLFEEIIPAVVGEA